jgi:two-component system NtrC family sensor kinase
MNGLELARLVREHHPAVHIILASGYSEQAATAVAEGFVLLNKPYSLEVLRSALAQAVPVAEPPRHKTATRLASDAQFSMQ